MFGGWSNDRLITVTCDQYDPNKLRFCDQTGETFQEYGKTSTPPFRNDFKLAGNYPLPWGLEVSGVFMSYAGKGNSYTAQDPSLGVYWSVPASVFPNGQRTRVVTSAPILLAAGTQTQAPGVNLISPNTKFQDRWNQLDLSAKRTFRFGDEGVPGAVRGVQRDERQRRPPGSADLRGHTRAAAELPPGAHDAPGAAGQLLVRRRAVDRPARFF